MKKLLLLFCFISFSLLGDEPVQRYLKKYNDTASNLTVDNLNVTSKIKFNDGFLINGNFIEIINEIPTIVIIQNNITNYYPIAPLQPEPPEPVIPAVKPYPVFKLDMHSDYTDFEIKASTNNFRNLVYFYSSTHKNDAGYDDINPYTFHTDDYNTDRRKWIYTEPHSSIYQNLIKQDKSSVNVIYFYPSRNTEKPADDWMWQENPNLVWSLVRMNAVGFEMRVDNDRSLWNPIRPESWELKRTRIPEMDEIEPPVPPDSDF